MARGLYLFIDVPWYQKAINNNPSIARTIKEINKSDEIEPEDWKGIIQALVGERT